MPCLELKINTNKVFARITRKNTHREQRLAEDLAVSRCLLGVCCGQALSAQGGQWLCSHRAPSPRGFGGEGVRGGRVKQVDRQLGLRELAVLGTWKRCSWDHTSRGSHKQRVLWGEKKAQGRAGEHPHSGLEQVKGRETRRVGAQKSHRDRAQSSPCLPHWPPAQLPFPVQHRGKALDLPLSPQDRAHSPYLFTQACSVLWLPNQSPD